MRTDTSTTAHGMTTGKDNTTATDSNRRQHTQTRQQQMTTDNNRHKHDMMTDKDNTTMTTNSNRQQQTT
jgi:hypothetical protein